MSDVRDADAAAEGPTRGLSPAEIDYALHCVAFVEQLAVLIEEGKSAGILLAGGERLIPGNPLIGTDIKTLSARVHLGKMVYQVMKAASTPLESTSSTLPVSLEHETTLPVVTTDSEHEAVESPSRTTVASSLTMSPGVIPWPAETRSQCYERCYRIGDPLERISCLSQCNPPLPELSGLSKRFRVLTRPSMIDPPPDWDEGGGGPYPSDPQGPLDPRNGPRE